MILNKILLPSFLLLLLFQSCLPIEEVTVNENNSTIEKADLPVKVFDKVYDSNIHTVLFFKSTDELSYPILNLNFDEALILKFDDFLMENRDLSYRIKKCDKNWFEINENQNRYIEGFINGRIYDFENSHNTLTDFKHYEIKIPQKDDYSFSQSGNYIIEVYNSDNESEILFSKRFQVTEQLCNIEPEVKKASIISDANYKQEIDFKITPSVKIQNPIRELTVVLFKNGMRDYATSTLKPKFVDGNTLIYDYDNLNVFDGGNEFRALDLKTIKYGNNRVNGIDKSGFTYNVYLYPEEKRTYKKYSTIEDLNGQYIIKNQDAPDESHLSSEYLNVFFELNYPTPSLVGDLYIYGGLSDWKVDSNFMMKYDFNSKSYKGKILLKQGYYNYEYIYVKHKSSSIDESYIEGTHFATQNEYTIQVYWNDVYGEGYERLISTTTFNAHE